MSQAPKTSAAGGPAAKEAASSSALAHLNMEQAPVASNRQPSEVERRVLHLLDRIPFSNDENAKEYLAAVKSYEETVNGQVVSAKMFLQTKPNDDDDDDDDDRRRKGRDRSRERRRDKDDRTRRDRIRRRRDSDSEKARGPRDIFDMNPPPRMLEEDFYDETSSPAEDSCRPCTDRPQTLRRRSASYYDDAERPMSRPRTPGLERRPEVTFQENLRRAMSGGTLPPYDQAVRTSPEQVAAARMSSGALAGAMPATPSVGNVQQVLPVAAVVPTAVVSVPSVTSIPIISPLLAASQVPQISAAQSPPQQMPPQMMPLAMGVPQMYQAMGSPQMMPQAMGYSQMMPQAMGGPQMMPQLMGAPQMMTQATASAQGTIQPVALPQTYPYIW